MANYTEKLELLKKDPIADGNDTFNISTMLNQNWDKIDEAVMKLCNAVNDIIFALNRRAFKAEAPIQGNIATLDSDGCPTDSGKKPEDFAELENGKVKASQLPAMDYIPLAGTGGNAVSGPVSMGGNNIKNLAEPTLDNDAATKAYVDTLIAGSGNVMVHLYRGDGTYGSEDNCCSIDNLPRPPKMAYMVAYQNTNGENFNAGQTDPDSRGRTCMIANYNNSWPTRWKEGAGFSMTNQYGRYGRIKRYDPLGDPDGPCSLQWYHTYSADEQFNTTGYTFAVLLVF